MPYLNNFIYTDNPKRYRSDEAKTSFTHTRATTSNGRNFNDSSPNLGDILS